MKRRTRSQLIAGLLLSLTLGGCGRAETPRQSLERKGGIIEVDRDASGAPVNEIHLNGGQFTDEDLAHLRSFVDLQFLSLDETTITDDGLKQLQALTKLQVLELRGTKITDEGLQHLKGMASLQKLRLQNSNVTEEGIAELGKELPNLDIEH